MPITTTTTIPATMPTTAPTRGRRGRAWVRVSSTRSDAAALRPRSCVASTVGAAASAAGAAACAERPRGRTTVWSTWFAVAPATATGARTIVPSSGVAAAIVVAVVIGIAVALSGTLQQQAASPTAVPSDEDAIVAATVPVPQVQPGVPSADGAGVSFAVSHENPEEGDRYRWQRADGSGGLSVSEGPTIVVDGVAAGERVCIEVQVQRGSKTSEPVTGCTA